MAARTSLGETLSQQAAGRLKTLIADDGLAPGMRLPPEHVLVARLGVSRTVLREAVAGLRAQGLLTSRRGSGVFVADGEAALIDLTGTDAESLGDALDLLELRAAVEIEAAGLAARRRSDEQMQAIRQAYQVLDGQKATGLDAGDDLRFHRTIALATQNRRFAWFIDQIGRVVIPRQRLRQEAESASTNAAYARLLQSEHEAMVRAIEARDPALARDAMRQHLNGSAERYGAFLKRQENSTR